MFGQSCRRQRASICCYTWSEVPQATRGNSFECALDSDGYSCRSVLLCELERGIDVAQWKRPAY
jgi:hypothetical protein